MVRLLTTGLWLFILLFASNPINLRAEINIFPVPQHLKFNQGHLSITNGRALIAPSLKMTLGEELDEVIQLLDKKGITKLSKAAALTPGEQAVLSIRVVPSVVTQAEGYRLSITDKTIEIIANNEAGAFYGLVTLKQIIEKSTHALPCLSINDWPDFERRGVMLDVSRDKVPTMETVKLMIDRFASWKINELQLYIEHTFAYKNHETVWGKASPFTAEEILELDAYCADRFIDLVPNQNSLGHMHRWLDHKEYHYLAERPGDASSEVWHINNRRVTLSAVNPQSIAFMDSLFTEYLPNFSSKYVNVGGDEPYELGLGNSKAECERIGKSTVYLNYMTKIAKIAAQNGKQTQMWGDIVNKHPELIPQMPKDIICMVWGYRPDHPFAKQCPRFQEQNIPFYVCPGTSGWRSYIGKTDRSKLNIINAVDNGKKYGAIGVLHTDWGDRGHMQPITTAIPSFAFAAGMSWASEKNRDVDLVRIMNEDVFKDASGMMGDALLQLTNAYKGGQEKEQALAPYFQMMDRIEFFFTNEFKFSHYDLELLPEVRKELAASMKKLEKANPTSLDAKIAVQEMKTAARLADWGCRFVEARLAAKDQDVYNISKKKRMKLAEELSAIEKEHRQTWLLRNRPGGLDDSAARMEQVASLLQKN